MKNYILKSVLVMLAISALTLQSCNREKWDDNDTQAAQDQSLAEATENDIFKQSDDAINSDGEYLKTGDVEGLNGPCATITHDTVSNPKKVIIDFGTTNCTGNDGKARRGKIIITYTGKHRMAGSVLTITTDNFYVNDNKIELTKSVTCNGLDANGHISWNIVVTNGKIILANNGGTMTWSSNRTRKMIAGMSTPKLLADDQFEISGSANGVTLNGVSYTMNITSPLLVDFGCAKARVTKGVMKFSAAGKADRVIDFGNGTCDDQATVSIGNLSKVITLKR